MNQPSPPVESWRSGLPTIRAIPDLVSVIVPVYNRQRIVCKTLDSIIAQTYSPIEILAIDDGSSDGSRRVLEEYAQRYPDVVRVVAQSNQGQAVARNAGIRQARGEFIAFLDSDDIWVPRKLEQQIPLLVGEVGLVYSAINEMDASGRSLRIVPCEANLRGNIYHELLVRNRMTGGTVVVRRAALERVGLFDEQLRAAENWDLWIRISREFEVDYVDLPLTGYLKHTQSLSFDTPRMREAATAVLRKHFPEPPSLGDPLLESYHAAYADFYYRWGIQLFSEGDYSRCREMFRRCWEHAPAYRDSRPRYFRSLLGRPINSLLSRLRESLS